ncbi:MAG: CPBP family intramembrane metalloprotease [Deltaproteobacteria bacterium]|nr:CPBP family intramembrane metalloprotease [Deltaproteobacteria bacterium]
MISVLAIGAGCVSPQLPPPAHPPAPDRFERAANADPNARKSAADELVGDPSPQAAQMLVVLHQRDIDPAVRAHAAAAIAERRDPDLEETLETSAASDPDPNVRAASAAAQQKLFPWRKRPGTAAGLALLCPGCGHFYLRQNSTAVAYIVAQVALFGSAAVLLQDQTFDINGNATSARVPVALVLAATGQNLLFYGIFDAYRDARVGRDDLGYKFKISRESLGDLASASFRPSVLKSPWVWAGVPLLLAAGLGASYLAAPDEFTGSRSIFEVDKVNVFGKQLNRGTGFAAGFAYFASLFTSVGVGEEALFRGVIQTEMEERFGTYGGLAIASVIFGSVHVFNFINDPQSAAIAVPVISILGSAMGLAYIHTDHKLATSVAMHFWYNTLLSAVAFAADPEHQPFVVNYNAAL